MPVVPIVSSQHNQDIRDDGAVPAPIGPVGEEGHPLTSARVVTWDAPDEMRNEHQESEPEEEVGAVTLVSALSKVTIVLVSLEWLSQSEQEAVKKVLPLGISLSQINSSLQGLFLRLDHLPINWLLIFDLHL